MNYKDLRKCLAVAALIIDGVALALPDPFSKFAIGLATGLNAASLYLIKEESINASGQVAVNETG